MRARGVHTLILGAGPAGLAAGYRLAQKGMKPVLLEGSGAVGGLMRGIRRGEFIVDIGRKELYSRIPAVDNLWKEILGGEYRPYDHRIGVLYKGHVLEYSRVYKGMRRGMPWAMFARGAADLVWAKMNPFKPSPRTSREFLFRNRGKYFSQVLLGGFRDKFCGEGWSERPAPDVSRTIRGTAPPGIPGRIRRSAVSAERPGKAWHHPSGGTGQITAWLEREITSAGGAVHCGALVEEIHSSDGEIVEVKARVNDREVTYRPEHVVSSIRIEELIRLLTGNPTRSVIDTHTAKRNGTRSTLAAYLFLNEPPRIPHVYLNVTCPLLRAGRITNYAAFGGTMVPPGKSCLCVEYFCDSTDDLFRMNGPQLRDLALEECSSSNLVDPALCFDYLILKLPGADAAESFSTWTTPDKQQMLRQLESFRDLYFVSRPGTDMATFAGLKAADAILSGDRTEFDRVTNPTLDPLSLDESTDHETGMMSMLKSEG